MEALLNIYWTLNNSNSKNSSHSILLLLVIATNVLLKNSSVLYVLTLPLVGVCALSTHQKERLKCWGARYTLGVHYGTIGDVILMLHKKINYYCVPLGCDTTWSPPRTPRSLLPKLLWTLRELTIGITGFEDIVHHLEFYRTRKRNVSQWTCFPLEVRKRRHLVSPRLKTGKYPVSETLFSTSLQYRTMIVSWNPVILSVIYHRQNPSDSTYVSSASHNLCSVFSPFCLSSIHTIAYAWILPCRTSEDAV
jgi:hypothetical protein